MDVELILMVITMDEWKLTKKTIKKGTVLDNYANKRDYKQVFHKDVEVEVLEKGKAVWMSNSPMEQDTNRLFIGFARGHVLIAGLGMGWVLEQIQEKPGVESITVIEIDKSLINYITKMKKFNSKVKIVNDDIWKYLETCKDRYDIVWLDIWEVVAPDNIVEIYPLEFLAKKLLREKGEVRSWVKDVVEQMCKDAFGVRVLPKRNIIKEELKKRGIKRR